MKSILKLVCFAQPALLLVPAFTGSLLAQAQTTAVWHGYVRNSASAPVAGAKIQLTGAATDEARTSVDGGFTLPELPPGKYKLIVEAEGRQVAYAQAIDLTPASPFEVVTLSSRGEVEVSEQQQTGATGGVALSSQAVSELPRDFSSLLLLAAGTMTDTNGATNFTAQFAINGQRGVEATFAMDGADISDPEMGGATISNFNVDAAATPSLLDRTQELHGPRGRSGDRNTSQHMARQHAHRLHSFCDLPASSVVLKYAASVRIHDHSFDASHCL